MPRTPKQQGSEKQGVWDYSFKGFVSCSLNEEQKTHFYAWIKEQTAEDVLRRTHEMIERGYKFSWSLGGNNNSCIATFTCNNPVLADRGLALSGFADDLWTALYVVLFKHEVVLEGSWAKASHNTGNKSGIG